MTVRIGVTGGTGQMGRAVIDTVVNRDDCTVSFAVNRDPAQQSVRGSRIEHAQDFETLVVERDVDVVVDFTGPESAVSYAQACAETGVAFVTGTTGFDEDDRNRLRETSERIPLMHAPNFARGVQALVNVVDAAVRNLPGYDVEVVETHHNRKRDAPSGTAKRLLETIEAAGDFDGRQHGREGDAPRTAGEIGVHALRAGSITGEHEVILANNDEELRLKHRAEDRQVFAAGAVDAAIWIAGRKSGWYDFADVIDE